jgi:hypothetical protein
VGLNRKSDAIDEVESEMKANVKGECEGRKGKEREGIVMERRGREGGGEV